jgi:heme A synthase
MPSPRKPIIELTPRVQAVAAVVLLAASALLGAVVATSDAPRQRTDFGRNFAPIVVVPAAPSAPTIEQETPRPAAPLAPPAETLRGSEI